MRKVVVKLEIEYDEAIYDHPVNWNWVDILCADDEGLTLVDVDYDEQKDNSRD